MANKRHGLTVEQIYTLAQAQDFKCALSKKPFIIREREIFDPTTGKRVAIDHDHTTGYIRGLLVQKVNWLIDQWEQKSYGALSMPPEIVEYKTNPPAFGAIGKIKYI